MSIRLKIIAAIQQIATEQHVRLPPLEDNLSLHETGFDSLAFAILVARLEDEIGQALHLSIEGIGASPGHRVGSLVRSLLARKSQTAAMPRSAR